MLYDGWVEGGEGEEGERGVRKGKGEEIYDGFTTNVISYVLCENNREREKVF